MPSSAPKPLRRGRRFLATVALCVGIVLLGGAVALAASTVRMATNDSGEPAPERLPNVRVMPIERILVEDVLRLTGSAEPWHDLTLSAEVGGRIVTQPVSEGQAVRAGDLLLRIDTDRLTAQLDEIEARLELARVEASRLDRLRDRGAITLQDADRAATEVRVLEANLRTARIALDRSVVRAPVDGVVDTLHYEESEFVDTGMPLVRIVQVDRLKVAVGLPERDVPAFALGDTVQIALDALPGRTYDGVIRRIATTASAGTRTFLTEIAIDNAEGAVLPGMIARASFVRQRFPNSILIPMFSIVPLENRRIVFVVEDGVAQIREVTTGLVQGANVQIHSGLDTGDQLIVTGQRDVRPGGRVAVRDELDSTPEPLERQFDEFSL